MVYKKLLSLVLIFTMFFASSTSYAGKRSSFESLLDTFMHSLAISAAVNTASHGITYMVYNHPKTLLAGTVGIIALWYYIKTQKEKRHNCHAQVVY